MVRATLRVYEGIGEPPAKRRPPTLRLTLELVTVGDFALPIAGLFVQVKGQSAGARDLLQAGPCTPGGARDRKQKKKGACVSLKREEGK